MSPKERPDAPDPDATLPAEERGTRSLDNPNDTARWLALADTALSRGASDDAVAETERLARKEQAPAPGRDHQGRILPALRLGTQPLPAITVKLWAAVSKFTGVCSSSTVSQSKPTRAISRADTGSGSVSQVPTAGSPRFSFARA